MKNAELLVQMLEEAGVRWVFGIPSGPVLPFIDALRQSQVQFVLTASETSAGFMAATVGQLTGVPGVGVATLGPGATNLTTGIGAAWLDATPALAITCNVGTPWLDRRIQMRIDHHGLFGPLTKASFPLRTEDFADTVARALALAVAETPGPVHLDFPEDVAVDTAVGGPRTPSPLAGEGWGGGESSRVPPRLALKDQPPLPNPPPPGGRESSARVGGEGAAQTVAEALARSRRPLVITGLSFARSRAADQLLQLVERHNLPFISTLHGKGCLPESHPNWCGVLGRARRTDVQAFVNRADLILAVGYDEIEINYEEWAGTIPIVHLSTAAADVSPDLQVLVNAGGDMDAMITRLAELPPTPHDWTQEEFSLQRGNLDEALRPEGGAMALHHVLDVLRPELPAEGILAYDVGAHTHQIATQWRTDRPQTCLATNGWSSMGYGMPAAYAAKLVHPELPVVAVVGDGGFQMTVGELALARRLNLAVPTIVLNDGWLGLMKVKQERKHYPESGVFLGDPPPSPAHYFGVPCRGVRTTDELQDAIRWGFSLDGPSVIEAFIDVTPYSETVYD